jgi:hypothetical protein
MARCKRIRDLMDADYDTATDRGIRKKLLKRIIKKRELERKIVSQAADLEPFGVVQAAPAPDPQQKLYQRKAE